MNLYLKGSRNFSQGHGRLFITTFMESIGARRADACKKVYEEEREREREECKTYIPTVRWLITASAPFPSSCFIISSSVLEAELFLLPE